MILAVNKQTGEKSSNSKRLIIGLDFGTAFSKVVIGDNRVRYAVPFGDFSHSKNQYLLPSILSIDTNKHCHLPSPDCHTSSAESLKLPLLDGLYTNDELMRITAYFALIFRHSTSWLLRKYKKRYGRCKLSWTINAAIPVNNTDNSKLSTLYQQLIHAAWTISVMPGPITLNRVSHFMAADEKTFDTFPAAYKARLISKQSINTFPACCAQICAYLDSKQCKDGLHMLIDVGAGSLSIVTFSVSNDVEGSCELYACEIKPNGVNNLLKRRHENLKLPYSGINLFKDIPDTGEFSQMHNLTEKDIMFADTVYSGVVARLINKALDTTEAKYRTDSECWEEGVATFAYGGGARLEIVQNIIHSHQNMKSPHKIRVIALNPPPNLLAENITEDSYDRLSVAYGLSFEPDRINQAKPMNTKQNLAHLK